MAQPSNNVAEALRISPTPNPPRRVKVYELKNQDWVDRGTGFCTGIVKNVRRGLPLRPNGWERDGVFYSQALVIGLGDSRLHLANWFAFNPGHSLHPS